MKRSIYFSIVFLLVIIIFCTCAQRGFDSPIGVTGGSDGGYGYSKDYYRQSSNHQNDEVIHGVWTNNNETLTLTSESSFELKSNEQIIIGTFTISEEILSLNYRDGQSVTYKYNLTNDRLILNLID